MSDRIIPQQANKHSIANRKPVYGIGVNDADYMISTTINGKLVLCPYYEKWHGMLKRCFEKKYQERFPAYIGCSVIEKWLSFMNFKSWMIQQDWEGKALDKDIIKPGNKVYSPDTCCFVTQAVNCLLTAHGAARGLYPQGVSFHKASRKLVAQININGERKHLGLFGTPQEASEVYRRAKCAYIIEIASQLTDIRIKNGLMKHAELLN